jgi:hypothetical protein
MPRLVLSSTPYSSNNDDDGEYDDVDVDDERRRSRERRRKRRRIRRTDKKLTILFPIEGSRNGCRLSQNTLQASLGRRSSYARSTSQA